MCEYRQHFGDLLPNRSIWDITELISLILITAHPLGFIFDPRQLSFTAYNKNAHAVTLDGKIFEMPTTHQPPKSNLEHTKVFHPTTPYRSFSRRIDHDCKNRNSTRSQIFRNYLPTNHSNIILKCIT